MLIAAVGRLMSDAPTRRAAGIRELDGVRRYHAQPVVLDCLSTLFDRVIAGARARRRR